MIRNAMFVGFYSGWVVANLIALPIMAYRGEWIVVVSCVITVAVIGPTVYRERGYLGFK